MKEEPRNTKQLEKQIYMVRYYIVIHKDCKSWRDFMHCLSVDSLINKPFKLFLVRFTAALVDWNNVSVFHSPRLLHFCHFFIWFSIVATCNFCTFTALVSTHAVCIHTVPRILFQVPSTSGTMYLRSNLVCGVVIKGQETQFTLIAVSVFIP